MKFKPLYNFVLILPEPPEETTKSGIIIPDIAKKPPGIGTVKEVGSMIEDISQGDRVMYNNGAGTEINVDGVFHIVMKADEAGDVIAILE